MGFPVFRAFEALSAAIDIADENASFPGLCEGPFSPVAAVHPCADPANDWGIGS